MRCGFVERRVQLIAQRRRERGLVTRLHLQQVDQRRPQIALARPQQIGERFGFRRQASRFLLRRIERRARPCLGFRRLAQAILSGRQAAPRRRRRFARRLDPLFGGRDVGQHVARCLGLRARTQRVALVLGALRLLFAFAIARS